VVCEVCTACRHMIICVSQRTKQAPSCERSTATRMPVAARGRPLPPANTPITPSCQSVQRQSQMELGAACVVVRAWAPTSILHRCDRPASLRPKPQPTPADKSCDDRSCAVREG
jgi:hypothetical protein